MIYLITIRGSSHFSALSNIKTYSQFQSLEISPLQANLLCNAEHVHVYVVGFSKEKIITNNH
jgi:hypothetical protein